jgi:hypothetical protein
VAIQRVPTGAQRRWIKRGERGGMPVSILRRREISVATLRKEGTGLPRRFAPRNDEKGGFCNGERGGLSEWRVPPMDSPRPMDLPSPAWRARGWPQAGRGFRTMRSVATLISWRWGWTGVSFLFPLFYSAALRAGWNALDCHVAALLAMTSSSDGFLSCDGPSLPRLRGREVSIERTRHCKSLPTSSLQKPPHLVIARSEATWQSSSFHTERSDATLISTPKNASDMPKNVGDMTSIAGDSWASRFRHASFELLHFVAFAAQEMQ